MPLAQARWVILEGGTTQTFPLSINQSVEWIRQRRGECSAQINTSYEKDGILSYSLIPSPSSRFSAKEFMAPGDVPYPNKIERFWAYSRWWRVNSDKKYRLEYTGFGQENAAGFTVAGFDDFNQDGDDEIRLIATDGDGRWFILKQNCAYTFTNANGDSTGFRKSAPYYGMGCSNPGTWVSNCVIAGNVVAAWNAGGDSTMRHYMWDGLNGSTELSRNVRALAGGQAPELRCSINWAQNLVVCGGLVYDLDNKRVLYYDTAKDYASATTRPYFEVQFKPITVYALAFVTNGVTGSFTVQAQYGQAEHNLGGTRTFSISVTENQAQRFRHALALAAPFSCRVWRLMLDNLTGIGITQIEALMEVNQNVEGYNDQP